MPPYRSALAGYYAEIAPPKPAVGRCAGCNERKPLPLVVADGAYCSHWCLWRWRAGA